MERPTEAVVRARRAHTKSRMGCVTCRQRRIRCDEFRPACLNCSKKQVQCVYFDSAPDAVPDVSCTSGQLLQYLCRADPVPGIDWTSLEPFPTPSRDKFLIHQTAQLATQMSRHGKHVYLASQLLPEFIRLSQFVDYARYSMCALVTTYIGMLTKSSPIDVITHQYKGLALRDLRAALNEPVGENVEAIIAASFLLSWAADGSEEYVELSKGMLSALELADDMGIRSPVIDYWRLPYHIDVLRRVPLAVVVQRLLPTLRHLRHYVRHHEIYFRALKELIHFVSNLRMFLMPDTIYGQLRAIYPIRYWLHWTPGLLEHFCTSDPLAAIFLAHYHMVIIAVMPYFPAAARYFALHQRCQQVDALWQMLQELAKTSRAPWAWDLEELMREPRSIAVSILIPRRGYAFTNECSPRSTLHGLD